MPVKKSSTSSRNVSDMMSTMSVEKDDNGCHGSCGHFGMNDHCKCRGFRFGHRLMKTFFGILVVYLIIFVGTLIRNEIKKYEYIGVAPTNISDRQLNISAEGTVKVVPNLSQITVGNSLREITSAEATAKNEKLISDFVTKVKALGIPSTDIKTESPSMYPEYTYKTDGTRELAGYNIDQSVTVKVRDDVEKAGKVVALAGEVGLNTIGGVESTIDDTEVYLEEARQQAVNKAKVKAVELANMLGVKLDGVVAYSEYMQDYYPMYSKNMAMESVGLGGGGNPTIEPGTSDVKINVNVTYKIK